MAGIKEFQRGRGQPAALVGPFDLAAIRHALKHGGVIVHLLVRVERVFADAQLLALARHHVDRVVQHPFHDEVAVVGHHHPGMGEVPQRHWQRADVVEMAVGDRDRIHGLVANLLKERQAGIAIAARMRAGIQQDAVPIQAHQPGAGPDVRIRIEVGDLQGGRF